MTQLNLAETGPRAQTRGQNERGNSTVEFIGAAAGLLIPALLFIVAVMRVQSAAFAAQSAAQEVARAYSLSRAVSHAESTARAIANLAFLDHGLNPPQISVNCADPKCQSPGTAITARVSVAVPLLHFGNLQLGSFEVSATSMSYLGEFVERGR